MKIQKPAEFLQDFITLINASKSSISLTSMNFEEGPYINEIVDALVLALKRGVKVTLSIDWIYQHYNDGYTPVFFRINKKSINANNNLQARTKILLNNLISYGAQIHINNIPRFPLNLFKISGRNHKKIYSIDNKYLWIGGINLYSRAFKNYDLMVKIEDSELVSKIVNGLESVKEIIELNDNSKIFIDKGIPGQSIIYKTACKQIKSSKNSISFVSQFLPDYFMVYRLIKLSRKGIKVTIYTSSPQDKKFTGLFSSLNYRLITNKFKNAGIKLINYKGTVHAKLIIVDKNIAILGSHNFVIYGGLLGTEEIAMVINSDQTLNELGNFLSDLTLNSF